MHAMKLLAVCTANICRSPSIEVAMRTIATSRGVDIEISSAGTRSSGGQPADTVTQAVAKQSGFDLSTHVSQALTAELVDWADLVLCAELDHLGVVLGLREDALAKSFLFCELVDIVTIRHEGDDAATWLHRVGRHRTASSVLGTARRFNLADPYKRGRRRNEEMVEVVATGADRLVEAIAG
jgi:protein-tyrosine-phosphatase